MLKKIRDLIRGLWRRRVRVIRGNLNLSNPDIVLDLRKLKSLTNKNKKEGSKND